MIETDIYWIVCCYQSGGLMQQPCSVKESAIFIAKQYFQRDNVIAAMVWDGSNSVFFYVVKDPKNNKTIIHVLHSFS